MDNVIIKQLEIKMVDDVFQIEKTFFPVTNKDSILVSLNNEHLNYYVLFVGDKIVGFLECSIVLDEAELYEIAIATEYQGKGYARLLMDFFVDVCNKKKIRTIFLEVNKNNSKAISLYNKFGFVEYYVRKNYYGDSDAILMKKVF